MGRKWPAACVKVEQSSPAPKKRPREEEPEKAETPEKQEEPEKAENKEEKRKPEKAESKEKPEALKKVSDGKDDEPARAPKKGNLPPQERMCGRMFTPKWWS